jgi:flagellar hook protein FlgE
MLGSLDTGVSGLQQFQARMEVIGNNIANVNTVGFKEGRTELADNFSRTLSNGSDVANQVGQGVATSGVYNQYTQGAVSATGVPTDVAISGNGFFVVRDVINSATYVTRAGDFRIDANNYLVTPGGLRVQGYSDAALATLGDIVIDGAQRPATSDPLASMVAFKIGNDGKIAVQLSDGTSYTRGQLLLQHFSNPQALLKQGSNLYLGSTGAGALAAPAAPGTSGTGTMQSGALELSNVDLANEFAQLITTQRAFQANARVITTSDEMLQDLINVKR